MSKRVSAGGVVRLVAGALAFCLLAAPAAFAKGGNDDKGNDHAILSSNHGHDDGDDNGRAGDHLFCPNKQVLVRIDEKTCPDKPGRPAAIEKRVCCRHGDTTNCHPFHPCPPRSRS